jgi:hypothetical protein
LDLEAQVSEQKEECDNEKQPEQLADSAQPGDEKCNHEKQQVRVQDEPGTEKVIQACLDDCLPLAKWFSEYLKSNRTAASSAPTHKSAEISKLENEPTESKAAKLSRIFESSMPIAAADAARMSVKNSGVNRFNDFYMAKQYPFLYARKFESYFRTHFVEALVHFYSTTGLHFVILAAVSVAIVGGYRTIGQCHRFSRNGPDGASVWDTQKWPNTCMMQVHIRCGIP